MLEKGDDMGLRGYPGTPPPVGLKHCDLIHSSGEQLKSQYPGLKTGNQNMGSFEVRLRHM